MPSQSGDIDKTRELLQKVRRVQVRTDRLANDVVVGEYKSVFKGRGMEFEEVREYMRKFHRIALPFNLSKPSAAIL